MNIPQTQVIALLEAIDFEYEQQLPPEAFEIKPGFHCEIEEYLGWEIQSSPTSAVIHARTGHTWIPAFEEALSVERIKVLIRKGIEADLARAMEVGR